jgi:hypothetical protein
MTPKQEHWLLKLWEADQPDGCKWISVTVNKPPTSVMKALQKKGYCKDIMGTFWAITDEGRKAAKTIY